METRPIFTKKSDLAALPSVKRISPEDNVLVGVDMVFRMTWSTDLWQDRDMTQKLASKFAEYREYHTTRGNVISHYVGIPLIATSLLGLLAMVTFGNDSFKASMLRPDLGWVLWAIGVGFYLYLDWKIALPFSLVMTGMYLIGRSLSLEILIAMQVVGWGSQYVGHLVYEKKSPAFYKNLTHMLIGPLWIFAKAIRYGGAA